MIYSPPNTENSLFAFKSIYFNFINGTFTAPLSDRYFDNLSPVDGQIYCKVARSSESDINLALDAAHRAFSTWKKTSVTERANILLKIADRIEENSELLAFVETWDNGKPIRDRKSVV